MNGCWSNLGDLEMIVQEYQPQILAIQEPHRVKDSDMDRILGGQYQWTTKTNKNLYHSVAIGIRKNITCTRIQLDTDLPIVAVRITLPFTASVVCGYLPKGKIEDLETY